MTCYSVLYLEGELNWLHSQSLVRPTFFARSETYISCLALEALSHGNQVTSLFEKHNRLSPLVCIVRNILHKYSNIRELFALLKKRKNLLWLCFLLSTLRHCEAPFLAGEEFTLKAATSSAGWGEEFQMPFCTSLVLPPQLPTTTSAT